MKDMNTQPTSQSNDALPPVMDPSTPTPPTSSAPQSPKRLPRRHGRLLGAVMLVGLVGLITGFAGAQLSSMLSGSNEPASRLSSGEDGNKIITEEEENISSVVAKVSPSVVSIVTEAEATMFPFGGSSTEQGAGTGIIVSKDGYVLTNKHVVEGVDTVGVVLTDGTAYEDVEVLGSDPLNDVAFLKIPGATDLTPADLGDSTSVRVGQKVIAIGNSLGQYQNTVTSGIISGTGRPVSAQAGNSIETLTDLIQTDAAINPGNSGGPLLNLQGQVIGINTAIAADAQGIGFAIPIGATKGILKGVLDGRGVQRAFLGINYIPVTADTADRFNLSVKKGAYVYNGEDRSAVASNSPAAKAGIKNGDVITKVGDIEVGDRGSVASLVAEYAPGETVQLTVVRDGRTLTLDATLTAYNR